VEFACGCSARCYLSGNIGQAALRATVLLRRILVHSRTLCPRRSPPLALNAPAPTACTLGPSSSPTGHCPGRPVWYSRTGRASRSPPPGFNTAHWKPAKRQAGRDGLRWHDLRHTAVALAIAQGAHPKAIQARLGHSSVQVTLDRYGHLFPELDFAIADGLEGTFEASPAPSRRADGAPQDPGRDTARTRVTRERHKKRTSGGQSRSLPANTKTAADQEELFEAASGIEPLYRVLQTLA